MRSAKTVFVAIVAVVSALATFVPANAAVTPPWDPFFADPVAIGNVGALAPASNRTYGVAAGDYDEDGDVDLIVGRADGRVARVSNNGNGTFAAPVLFTWKQASLNTWSF